MKSVLRQRTVYKIIASTPNPFTILVTRVSYQAVTSAQMIAKLTAAMADKTLNETLKHYAKWDVLIVDEFGFDTGSVVALKRGNARGGKGAPAATQLLSSTSEAGVR